MNVYQNFDCKKIQLNNFLFQEFRNIPYKCSKNSYMESMNKSFLLHGRHQMDILILLNQLIFCIILLCISYNFKIIFLKTFFIFFILQNPNHKLNLRPEDPLKSNSQLFGFLYKKVSSKVDLL